MDQSAVDVSSFTINPTLDVGQLGKTYQESRRLHIPNFLSPLNADRLYQHLSTDVWWRTLIVANEDQLGTPPGVILTPDQEREIVEFAYSGARSGFASLYDANRLLSEEAAEDRQSTSGAALFTRLSEFLNSSAFVDVVRRITGLSELHRVDVRATRFRPGHFVTFHDATYSADKTGKRCASYELGLTPEWRPEWGGMLQFRGQNGNAIEAFMPCFNALDIFAFPQGHWISVVSPFADGPRYAISGPMYVA